MIKLVTAAFSTLVVKPRRLWNKKVVTVIGAVFCTTGLLFAQARSKPLAFEVASIRRAAQRDERATGRRSTGVGTTTEDPGQVSYRSISLKSLLTKAYSVKPFQIRGPSWIDSERYDVNAEIPEGASKGDVPSMLQNLITERFQVSLHTETKEQPGYALLVGRGGSKLIPADEKYYSASASTNASESVLPPSVRLSTSGIVIPAATMEQFAELLSRFLDRPVIDASGLRGTFQISLRDVSVGGWQQGQEMQASIFTAVRELGLNLKPEKVPLEYIVIDKARKVPTEN